MIAMAGSTYIVMWGLKSTMAWMVGDGAVSSNCKQTLSTSLRDDSRSESGAVSGAGSAGWERGMWWKRVDAAAAVVVVGGGPAAADAVGVVERGCQEATLFITLPTGTLAMLLSKHVGCPPFWTLPLQSTLQNTGLLDHVTEPGSPPSAISTVVRHPNGALYIGSKSKVGSVSVINVS